MYSKLISNKIYALAKLIRLDKPIGFTLLMWPCWFGLAYSNKYYYDLIYLYFLFFVGSFLMRSVGCIINDIIDIKIDKQVKRTYNRPLASNKINILSAYIFVCVLLFLSFIIFSVAPLIYFLNMML